MKKHTIIILLACLYGFCFAQKSVFSNNIETRLKAAEENEMLCDSIIYYTEEGKPSNKEEFIYDERKEVIGYKYFYWAGSWACSRSIEYEFDKNGMLSCEYYWDYAYNGHTKDQYFYDSNNKLVLKMTYIFKSGSWIEDRKSEYIYDGDLCNCHDYIWSNKQWEYYGLFKTTYDNNGNKTSESYLKKENNELIGKWMREYNYDQKGNQINEIRYDMGYTGQWIESLKIEYTFNRNNDIILEVWNNRNNNLWNGYIRYSYQYDDQKRLLRKQKDMKEKESWVEKNLSEYNYLDEQKRLCNKYIKNNKTWKLEEYNIEFFSDHLTNLTSIDSNALSYKKHTKKIYKSGILYITKDGKEYSISGELLQGNF